MVVHTLKHNTRKPSTALGSKNPRLLKSLHLIMLIG